MKRIWLVLLIVPLVLAGCARHYVITLNNGTCITAQGKPQIKGGSYLYKDAQGKPATIGASRVADIAPASMLKKQPNQLKPQRAR